MATDWERVKQVLEQVLELPESQQAAALERETADDPDLRAQVRRYLGCEAQAREIHSPVPTGLGPRPPGALDDWKPGRTIGRYTVVGRIASGGMGTVYEAIQEKPRRHVALKVLRHAVEAESDRGRFHHEAEILGQLHHPGIAQVFEAGTHAEEIDGACEQVPYIAMELVEGARTLREYAREESLDLRARLQLFEQVCEAVHYGHTQGVVHRDLKPSNLLVGRSGDVKVIDFGIARAARTALPERTLTEAGALIGTLAYMSPEQWTARREDIGTQSDVYALGVVLYELLCDEAPHDLAAASLPEAARIVCEEAAVRPSRRGRAAVPEDLDWIALKALEKDLHARYASVAEFAADLRRFFTHEPILAGPPTTTYRLRKFVRRNRLAVAAASAVLIGLIVGIVGLSTGLVRARRAEALAKERLASEQRESAKARSLFDYVSDLVVSVRPDVFSADVQMREILLASTDQLAERFAEQPEVEAELRVLLGRGLNSLDETGPARQQLTRALELSKRFPEVDEALEGRALAGLAYVGAARGEHREAEQLLIQASELLAKSLGAGHATTLGTRLSAILSPRGSAWAETADRLEELCGDCERSLGEHAVTVQCWMQLGYTLFQSGQPKAGLALVERARELSVRLAGAYAPATLAVYKKQAVLLWTSGDYPQALKLLELVRSRTRERFGSDSTAETAVCRDIGAIYVEQGRFEDADELLRDTYEGYVQRHGESARLAAPLRALWSDVLFKLQRFEEAEEGYRASITTYDRTTADPAAASSARLGLATVLTFTGRLQEAEQELLAVVDQGALTNSQLVGARMYLAEIQRSRGDEGSAREEHLLAGMELAKTLPPRNQERLLVQIAYGEFFVETGRPAEAVEPLRTALEGFCAIWGPADPRSQAAGELLIAAHEAMGESASARAVRELLAKEPTDPK